MRDDAVTPDPAEVVQAGPSMALHRFAQASEERFDDVWTDGVIEHGGGAHLYGPAPEQEVIERVGELRDASDTRKRFVGKRLRELRHLRHRLRQNGWSAEPSARYEAVNIHLELQRVGVDERERGKRVGRGDRGSAAKERAASFENDIGGRGRELRPDRYFGRL